MNSSGRICAAIVLLIPTLVSTSRAADWPQYRGANHDGKSSEIIRSDWAARPPQLVWKRSLEPGLSSFSVNDGRVFTQVRRRVGQTDREFCVALDADTGKELWAKDVGIADYPHGGVGSDDGPRTTPSVDGGRVYVLSSYLNVVCLDAATGEEIWGRDLHAEIEARVIEWQNAASPLIVGDRIFLNCNAPNQRLLALSKHDGSTVWKGQDDVMTHATPIFSEVAGVPQVIFFAQSGLVSVAPDSGAVLWRYPFQYRISTAASPVVSGDLVYCSAAYGVGAGVVRVGSNGGSLQATQVWRASGNHMNHWATPVAQDGHFYGIYGQSLLSLRCIDAETGTEQWRQDGVGYGSVLWVGDHLLVLTGNGTLLLVEPNPTAYREVARFQALEGKCWNAPAVSNGRIYLRSTLEAAVFDVASEAPPPQLSGLKLSWVAENPTGIFRLIVSSEDGTPIEPARAEQVEVFVADDLGRGLDGWIRSDRPPTLADGKLQFDFVRDEASAQRYFRAQEQR